MLLKAIEGNAHSSLATDDGRGGTTSCNMGEVIHQRSTLVPTHNNSPQKMKAYGLPNHCVPTES